MMQPPTHQPSSRFDAVIRLGYRIAFYIVKASWYVTRPNHEGVFIAVWNGDDVLLARNSYRPWITLPGGSLKRGESFENAARRELREEAGITVGPTDLTFAGSWFHETDYIRDTVRIFELNCRDAPTVSPDNREVVWVAFVPAAEAEQDEAVLPVVRRYLRERREKSAAANG